MPLDSAARRSFSRTTTTVAGVALEVAISEVYISVVNRSTSVCQNDPALFGLFPLLLLLLPPLFH
jgi:hypothetical protein